MIKFGLIGRNIDYSFSRSYFAEKFSREKINATYVNFDLQQLSEFPNVLQENPNVQGFNVTIPYKQEIFAYLDRLDPVAREIGAVNTIKVEKDGSLTGYNTDYYGFAASLKPHLEPQHEKALVLGTGGASKAILYALKALNIEAQLVSRKANENAISYTSLSEEIFKTHHLLINCTPLGTFPAIEKYPEVPLEFLTPAHLVFDLIYNPSKTKLMHLAQAKGATALNGLKMLELQAERAWEIWSTNN